ncbi:hypothetical protein M405DRAFT_829373 [Rhizopogon salebrosus TDB-379]|nr:hypothetical protein M405DRAFT_829373 [Rhizopogon salebrosus TDB-379]
MSGENAGLCSQGLNSVLLPACPQSVAHLSPNTRSLFLTPRPTQSTDHARSSSLERMRVRRHSSLPSG